MPGVPQLLSKRAKFIDQGLKRMGLALRFEAPGGGNLDKRKVRHLAVVAETPGEDDSGGR